MSVLFIIVEVWVSNRSSLYINLGYILVLHWIATLELMVIHLVNRGFAGDFASKQMMYIHCIQRSYHLDDPIPCISLCIPCLQVKNQMELSLVS